MVTTNILLILLNAYNHPAHIFSDQAEYMGEFMLGTDESVDLWQFSGPYNITMKTTVIQKNCVPVTEEVYMSKGCESIHVFL